MARDCKCGLCQLVIIVHGLRGRLMAHDVVPVTPLLSQAAAAAAAADTAFVIGLFSLAVRQCDNQLFNTNLVD